MLLLGNGRLITRDPALPYLENGCVVMEHGLIVEIGETAPLREKYPSAAFINAKQGVIMPALINTHNHIYSAFARGASIQTKTPRGFMDILEGLWWKLDRGLSLRDVKYSALATFIDCIKNGVTTVFDHHASYGAVEDSLFVLGDVAHRLGLRASLCFEVSDRNGAEKCREAIEENYRWMEHVRFDKTGMLGGMMGLHAAFTLSDETLVRCREKTPADHGFHIHVAEGIEDVHDSLRSHGKPIVDRLFDLGLLGEKTLAVHCVHISPAEMELLDVTNTMVAHNPESNMGNAVGCPPTMEMMRRGLLVGLGTDGYTNDMLESYKVANILHKHHTCDPNAAWNEIPAMLFHNNRIMANRCFHGPALGILQKDAAADVIVTDYDPLTPMDENNLNSHILFGMNGRSVVTTICGGRVLMENRELVGIDEAQILAECRAQAQDFWNRV